MTLIPKRSFPKSLLLGLLACTGFGVTPARAGGGGANILVVTGTDAPAITAGAQLNTDLGETNTVTVVGTVPVSLAGFTQIFDTRYDDNPDFTAGEQAQYLAFLNAAPGNTIFLMGENFGFNVRNTPINNFITLAGGGVIAVPSRTVNGPQTVNPPFTGPNPLSGTNGLNSLTYAACGLVTSAGTGAFASQQAGGGCAIYFGVGTLANAPLGALVVVYDVNFIYDAQTRLNPPNTGVNVDNEIPFRLNLEGFAASPTTPPSVSSVSPGGGSAAGGTPVTITGTGFTGALGVTIGGTAATNVIVVGDTSITATTPAGPVGLASVIVATPDGLNGANSLFKYFSASLPQPFQISYQAPVSLQVVPNVSLLAPGIAYILSNQGGVFQASTATSWLTLPQTAGIYPGVIDMTANAAGLEAGSYQGSISVTAGSLAISVPVTLTVLLPASITASAASLPSAFGYSLGSATGYDVQVGPAGAPFTAQTSGDSSSWLTIGPASGIAPATIHVVIDPGQATFGTYRDSIVITSPGAPNSPLAIPVVMTVSGAISLLPQQVNGASDAGADATVAPNEIVSLYLTDFSCAAQPVVSLNGIPVAWSSYVPGLIAYAVPEGVTQPAVLSVACNGSTVWSFTGLKVAATMPAIFASGAGGSGQAAAVNADGTLNGASNAARRGSYVSVFVTGFGVFDVESADGLRSVAGTVLAQLGGAPATVQYAGASPGNTDGLQQVNVLLPANGPVGPAVPVTLWVNGTPTQTTTTIAVQ
jgi:uncharacterized protein (TIGR03437 family)